MEIFDSLTRKIRVVYAAKGKAWITHNGIKTDANGNIVGGRYIELDKISKDSLIEDGLGIIEVEDEVSGRTYDRDLTKKEAVKVEEVVNKESETTEKPKRKRRTKKEMQEARK